MGVSEPLDRRCSGIDGLPLGPSRPLSAGRLRVGARVVLFDKGEPAASCYLVRAGVALSYKQLRDGRRQVLRFVYPGDILGFNGHDLYGTTVEGCTDLELDRFDAADMIRMAEHSAMFRRWMMNLAFREVAEAGEHSLWLGRMSARERLASFLCLMAAQQDRKLLWLPMTRGDIGDHLGLTLETTCRAFSMLKRMNLITVPRRAHVRIVDPDGLRALTGNPQA